MYGIVKWKANLAAIFEACMIVAIEGTEAKYITSKLLDFLKKTLVFEPD